MSQTVLVLGLGTTGQAALHYCIHHDIPVAGYDDVVKENLRDVFHVPLYFKILPESVLKTLQSVILSPGISDQHPLVLQLQQHHIPIKSDIDYFAKRCPGTIIGITGANGKSTVTALVTHLLTCLGFRAVACGNFGYPVLQLLDQDPFDYYVVELSSYQLEWTSHLNAKVGCLLNITPNHLDRYHTIQAYQQAKERLFAQCDRVIMHTSVQPITMPTQEVIYFSEDPQKKDTALFHARMDDTGCMSFYQGSTCLWTFTHQKRLGTHHYANQLAALAILHGLSFSAAEACKHLHTFRGLPHRIEHIQSSDECVWINDSKSTTTTATIAALETMVQEYPEQSIILIMGGGRP
jgi:UDP-N-acetylmuramoylalanine--D-glutamate ligase